MSASPSPLFTPTNLGILGGSAALGGLAGLFPTPTNSTTNTGSSTSTNSNQSGQQQTDLQQLISLLQQVTGNTTGQTTGAGTTTSTPNLNPQSQQFIQNLTQAYGGLQAPSTQGYVQNQTAGIDANANAQSQAAQQIMASRGLSTSPVAGTTAEGINQNRINQINQVQAQAPLLQNQLQLQNLQAQGGFAQALPGLSGSTQQQAQAQNTVGTSNQTTSSQQQQSQQQQQFQQLWNYLNTQASGTSVTSGTSGGGIGSAIGGVLGGALGAAGALTKASDARLKHDIKPIDKALDKLKLLKASSWKWKGGQVEDSGFIAQDLEKVIPSLIVKDTMPGTNLKAINYGGLLPMLVRAMQELDTKVEALA